MKHLNITITGQVQGVTFRYSAKTEADRLGIAGIVQNLPGGQVYIEVEGDEKELEKFLAWCHEGPNLASVEEVEVKTGDLKNYSGFSIL